MKIKKAFFMLLELMLRFTVNPYLRARLLRLFGAEVGRNVRIYEIQLFNLKEGFRNLIIEGDVHIGMGCRIDLSGTVLIRHGATLSPGVTILTHSDPGSYHSSPVCSEFEPFVDGVEIGDYSWIGSNVTILAGSIIHERTVVGACSLVKGKLESCSLYLGVPAKKFRTINLG